MRVRVVLAVLGAVIVTAVAGSAGLQAQDFITKSPTAADWTAMSKLPDLGGVWEAGGAPRGGGAGPGTGAGAPRAGGPGAGTAGPAGVRPGGPPAPGPAGAPRGGGAGAGGRGGRGGGAMQLTPEAEARRKELQSKAVEDTTAANCLPPGMPGIMTQPYPMEFLLTPGKVTIVIEAYQQVRHIYTDGRKLPEDPDPKFHGTSVGHWDGDTLVVDTIGFSPLTQIAANVPHDGNMKIVERFRLTDPDTMVIDTTVTDPGVLAAPMVSSRSLRRHRNWTIAEYICEENNRNSVDQSGKAGLNLTPPGSPQK
jgi:hypothetical protein